MEPIDRFYLVSYNGKLWIQSPRGWLYAPERPKMEPTDDELESLESVHRDIVIIRPVQPEARNKIEYQSDEKLATEVVCGGELANLYLRLKEEADPRSGTFSLEERNLYKPSMAMKGGKP